MARPKKTKEIVKKELNPKQELFCQLYAGQGEYFGNGTRAYIIAYKIDVPAEIEYSALNSLQKKEYDIASAAAVQILGNIKVFQRCNELLDKLIKNKIVDRELVFTIMQREELNSKVSAIKEYNQLKQRITKKIDLTTGGESFKSTPEEREAINKVFKLDD